MLTTLQERKLTKMFRHIDGDGDDVLAAGDYVAICGRLLEALGAVPESPEAIEIADSYAVEWRELDEEAARAGGPVTLALWLGYRDRQLSGPDAFETMIAPYIATVFAQLDADGDGRLTADDVRRYLRGTYGLPPDELDEVLRRIDPAGRGWFSRADVDALARDYYFSNDAEAPGSWLLGRF